MRVLACALRDGHPSAARVSTIRGIFDRRISLSKSGFQHLGALDSCTPEEYRARTETAQHEHTTVVLTGEGERARGRHDKES